MTNPRLTGISNITGKVVYIRHATEWERELLAMRANGRRHDTSGAEFRQVVVAAEENRIIGFAVLQKGADSREACVSVSELKSRRGIGAPIVRHLMEYSPEKTVYAASGRPRYFTSIGFTRKRSSPAERKKYAERSCRLYGRYGSTLAVFERQ